MMSKMIPLDGAYRLEVATISGGFRQYRKDRRRGTIDVEDQSDRRAMIREGVAVDASATGPVAHLPGYRCSGCSRRNYFKTCGGCGSSDGVREDGV